MQPSYDIILSVAIIDDFLQSVFSRSNASALERFPVRSDVPLSILHTDTGAFEQEENHKI